mmetsp:Transcript_29439/g.41700  ORF Transcript_29439/g.41700 Transcript_29439/m.41700 type:complete len:148 (+) Transcript_29439:738-1181(+)
MNLSNLGSVLMSELFLKNMHKFKADLLIRHIVLPFAVALHSASPVQTSPFIAGFGNTITDTKAYDMVGIALSRIYQIGKDGSIVSHNAENSSSLATLPSTEQRKRNYSKLIGSKYQGYLDEQLLKDVEAHWTGLLSDDSVRSDSIPT